MDACDTTSDVEMMLPSDGRAHFPPLDASPGDGPFALPPPHSSAVRPSSAVFHSGGSINSQLFHSGSSHSSHNFGSNNLSVMPPPSWKAFAGPGLHKTNSNSNGLHKTNSNRSNGSYGFCDSTNTEKWMMELDDPEAFVDEVRDVVTDSPTAHTIAPPLGDIRRGGGSFHRRGRHGHGSGSSENFMMMFAQSGGCSRNQEGLNAGKPTNRPMFFSFKR